MPTSDGAESRHPLRCTRAAEAAERVPSTWSAFDTRLITSCAVYIALLYAATEMNGVVVSNRAALAGPALAKAAETIVAPAVMFARSCAPDDSEHTPTVAKLDAA